MTDHAPFTAASRKQYYVPKAVNHVLLAANAMRKSNENVLSSERRMGMLLLAIEEVLLHGSFCLPLLQDAVDSLKAAMRNETLKSATAALLRADLMD